MGLIDIIKKDECTGCMACNNICPRNAIKIENDEITGFQYPKINTEVCIDCGLCKKVCPVKNKLSENTREILVYACKNKDDQIRLSSSSGGIFSLIANYILDQNGIVFGAAFDDNLGVIHSWTDSKEELSKFRGSKYLQSEIGDSFRKVKSFLESNRKVLFTGTPCQVEGLLAFLGKDYENLYTQDLICHGVPSPKVWSKYLEYRESSCDNIIKNVNFRSKEVGGWDNFHMKLTYSNFEENIHHKEDPYMKFFLKNFDLRDTCYKCHFKKAKRKSDITLADFWGINNIRPEMNDKKGTTALLVNSSKGEEIWENIKSDIVWTEEKIEDIIKYNCLTKSVDYNPKRNEFFNDLNKEGFEKLIRKYIL